MVQNVRDFTNFFIAFYFRDDIMLKKKENNMKTVENPSARYVLHNIKNKKFKNVIEMTKMECFSSYNFRALREAYEEETQREYILNNVFKYNSTKKLLVELMGKNVITYYIQNRNHYDVWGNFKYNDNDIFVYCNNEIAAKITGSPSDFSKTHDLKKIFFLGKGEFNFQKILKLANKINDKLNLIEEKLKKQKCKDFRNPKIKQYFRELKKLKKNIGRLYFFRDLSLLIFSIERKYNNILREYYKKYIASWDLL